MRATQTSHQFRAPDRRRARCRRRLAICAVLACTWVFLGCIIWEPTLQTVEAVADREELSEFEGRWFDESLQLSLVVASDGSMEVLLPPDQEPIEGYFDGKEIRVRIFLGQAEYERRFVPLRDGRLAVFPEGRIAPPDSNWVLQRLAAREYVMAKAEQWARERYDEAVYWLAAII